MDSIDVDLIDHLFFFDRFVLLQFVQIFVQLGETSVQFGDVRVMRKDQHLIFTTFLLFLPREDVEEEKEGEQRERTSLEKSRCSNCCFVSTNV